MTRTLLSSRIEKDEASGLYVEVKTFRLFIEDRGPMGFTTLIPRDVTESRSLPADFRPGPIAQVDA